MIISQHKNKIDQKNIETNLFCWPLPRKQCKNYVFTENSTTTGRINFVFLQYYKNIKIHIFCQNLLSKSDYGIEPHGDLKAHDNRRGGLPVITNCSSVNAYFTHKGIFSHSQKTFMLLLNEIYKGQHWFLSLYQSVESTVATRCQH